MILNHLKSRRTELGLTQGELAERIGVSRQALIGIEAGRHIPSTAVALQLARALRCTVDDLFRLPSGGDLRVRLAPPLSDGETAGAERVVLGLVDGRWAAHVLDPFAGAAADGILQPIERGADAPDAEARVEALGDTAELERNVLVAGCAPLLGTLAARLSRRYRDARASWVHANSARALDLLEAGLVHVAGLHLVDATAPGGHDALVRARFGAEPMTIVNLARWRQGLVVPKGNPLGIRDARDALRPDVRFAAREAGAGASALLGRLLPDGAEPGGGAALVARGHAEVARLVRWGVADTGVAIEAAAVAEGLELVPLAEERFDLVVPTARLAISEVARLLDCIDDAAFRAEAARVPGYDLGIAGHAAAVGAP